MPTSDLKSQRGPKDVNQIKAVNEMAKKRTKEGSILLHDDIDSAYLCDKKGAFLRVFCFSRFRRLWPYIARKNILKKDARIPCKYITDGKLFTIEIC